MKKRRRGALPLGGLLLCVQASMMGAVSDAATDAVNTLDGASALALVQQSLHLYATGGERAAGGGSLEADETASGKMASMEAVEAVEAALSGWGSRFVNELQAFEEEQESELQNVREIHAYIEKLQVTQGRRGTLLGEMQGLAPAGQMNEMDERMVARALLPFRSKPFVKSVADGLQSLAKVAPTLVWRSQKHVADLIRKSAKGDQQEIRRFLVDFFQKEQFMLQSTLDTVNKVLTDMLAHAPGKPSVKVVWRDLLEQLMQKATKTLDSTMKSITTDFRTFCGEGALDVFLIEQVLPMLNHTADALPRIGDFARSKVPDVAPQVSEAAKWLSEIVGSLVTSLEGEASVWAEKVCGLAGAVARV